jgi:hypothetical protein
MFSAAVSVGSRLNDWKMKPILVPAQQGERLVLERGDLGITDVDLARGGTVEAGEHVQQGRLAGARRAHDRGELTGRKADADVVERVHGGVAVAVGLADVRRASGGPGDGGCGRAGGHLSSMGDVVRRPRRAAYV